MDCKKVYQNLHLETNPAFSWMLYILLKHKILNDQQYNEYIQKFNEKSEKFSFISKKIIRGEELLIMKKPEINNKINREETQEIHEKINHLSQEKQIIKERKVKKKIILK